MGNRESWGTATPGNRLMATGNDPNLGVHVVTEFLYCPRAGVITYEEKSDDHGEETRSIRLGYQPKYDLKKIAEEIGRITMLLLVGIGAATSGILVAGLLAVTLWPWAIVACWLLFLGLLVGVPYGLWVLLQLTYRHAKAVGAKPKEPVFTDGKAVKVDWWGLVAAGFELRLWPDSITIPEWKLTGRPWRILVRGETYIPVFLRKGDNDKLYKQHYARMAAYCELLSETAWGNSPYGVILYASTGDAIALPNTPTAKRALGDGVRGMRQLVRVIATGPMLVEPGTEAACLHCPHGYMKSYSEDSVLEEDRKTMLFEHGTASYYSECGDRFQWTPPHESAFALGARKEV